MLTVYSNAINCVADGSTCTLLKKVFEFGQMPQAVNLPACFTSTHFTCTLRLLYPFSSHCDNNTPNTDDVLELREHVSCCEYYQPLEDHCQEGVCRGNRQSRWCQSSTYYWDDAAEEVIFLFDVSKRWISWWQRFNQA